MIIDRLLTSVNRLAKLEIDNRDFIGAKLNVQTRVVRWTVMKFGN